MLPSPTICIDYSSDTTAPKSRRVGVAAFHGDLNASSAGDALSLPAAMPYALGAHARMVTASGRGEFLEEKQTCQEETTFG
jgi:hypothetical protein